MGDAAAKGLGRCGRCHRNINEFTPIGNFIGGDKMPHIAHKSCAEDPCAEANPVVVTSREELLGNVLPIDVPPPPAIASSPVPPPSGIELTGEPQELPGAPEYMQPQPSAPVREQQAARRKPPGRPKKEVTE